MEEKLFPRVLSILRKRVDKCQYEVSLDQGNRILIDFILAPNHHPKPPTIILSLSKDRPPNHHPEPLTLHPEPLTLHPEPLTLHPEPLTLHPEPLTHHPEPVEGLSPLGVARGDEMDRNGPTLAYYVYLLRCSDGSYYVGHTNDLEHRLAAHERGAIEGYTLSRRPVELVFSDQFSARLEAFHRERRIKGWSGARKEALIKGGWDGLVE